MKNTIPAIVILFMFCFPSLATEKKTKLSIDSLAPLVVLILPSLDDAKKNELILETNEWVNYRETQNYEFHYIGLHEIIGKEEITYDEAVALDPEEIRYFLRDRYSEEIESNPDRLRYLGLVSDRQRSYVIKNTKNVEKDESFVDYSEDLTLEFFFEAYPVVQDDFLIYAAYNTCHPLNKQCGFYIKVLLHSIQVFSENKSVDIDFGEYSWHHLAITSSKKTNTSKIYVDGTFKKNLKSLIRFNEEEPFRVGSASSQEGYNGFSGKIDEFRISKGIVYTNNFEVNPASIEPNGNTLAMWNFEDIEVIEKDNVLTPIIPDVSGNSHYLLLNNNIYSEEESIKGKYLNFPASIINEYDYTYEYPEITRYSLRSDWNYLLPSDYPFSFINFEGIIDRSLSIEEFNFDINDAKFIPFRIPISYSGDLKKYLDRAIEYEKSFYEKDLILVAGEYGVEGDTSLVQCVNEQKVGNASKITKIFDSTVCDPDYVSESSENNLFEWMEETDGDNDYSGGMVYNISHGSSYGIEFKYDEDDAGSLFNLNIENIKNLNSEKLNVFVSLGCSNDSDDLDLEGYKKGFSNVYYKHSGVASISGSSIIYMGSLTDIKIGETDFLPLYFNDGLTIGESLDQLKKKYYGFYQNHQVDYGYFYSNIFSFNIYGDPLLELTVE